MLAPEALVASDQVKPVPLPPEAVKAWLLPVDTLAVAGVTETPAVTVMLRLAVLPRESVTWTISVTLPVAPPV